MIFLNWAINRYSLSYFLCDVSQLYATISGEVECGQLCILYSDSLRPEIAPCQCSGKCHISVRPFSGKYTNVSFCATITAPLICYIGNEILQIERRVDKSG